MLEVEQSSGFKTWPIHFCKGFEAVAHVIEVLLRFNCEQV